MGLASWLVWLGQDIDKLKVLLTMTKDEEQKELIKEIIEDLEHKQNEYNN